PRRAAWTARFMATFPSSQEAGGFLEEFGADAEKVADRSNLELRSGQDPGAAPRGDQPGIAVSQRLRARSAPGPVAA
ncbi:hypothetical protein C1T14_26385, partial [Escherichia coli]